MSLKFENMEYDMNSLFTFQFNFEALKLLLSGFVNTQKGYNDRIKELEKKLSIRDNIIREMDNEMIHISQKIEKTVDVIDINFKNIKEGGDIVEIKKEVPELKVNLEERKHMIENILLSENNHTNQDEYEEDQPEEEQQVDEQPEEGEEVVTEIIHKKKSPKKKTKKKKIIIEEEESYEKSDNEGDGDKVIEKRKKKKSNVIYINDREDKINDKTKHDQANKTNSDNNLSISAKTHNDRLSDEETNNYIKAFLGSNTEDNFKKLMVFYIKQETNY